MRAHGRSTMRGARFARGRTLVELMVSLTIAAIVLGAVLITVAGTGASGRRQDAQGILAEEGQIALGLVTTHLRMSGSLMPRAVLNLLNPDLNHLLPSQALLPFGCRNGFTDATANNLTCAGGAFGDAIAVRYQVDQFNSVQRAGQPTDCLGRTIPETNLPGVGVGRFADNRFFVANNPATGNPALFCRGSGGGAPQVLLDNVELMRVQYGLLSLHPDNSPKIPVFNDTVANYVNADDAALVNNWRRVGTIRLCLLMRTGDNVAEEPTPFQNCDGNVVASGDRRLRRAVFATVALRDSGAPAFPAP